MKITVQDDKTFVGTFLAFDKHMNIVLADCEEFRRIRTKKNSTQTIPGLTEREEKRTLGLIIIRGENVVSLQIEGPPPSHKPTVLFNTSGPGIASAVGRGVLAGSMAPKGLQGPIRGMGGAAPTIMQPAQVAVPAPQMPIAPMNLPPGIRPPMMPPGRPMMPPAGMPPAMGMPPMGIPPGARPPMMQQMNLPPGARPPMPPGSN